MFQLQCSHPSRSLLLDPSQPFLLSLSPPPASLPPPPRSRLSLPLLGRRRAASACAPRFVTSVFLSLADEASSPPVARVDAAAYLRGKIVSSPLPRPGAYGARCGAARPPWRLRRPRTGDASTREASPGTGDPTSIGPRRSAQAPRQERKFAGADAPLLSSCCCCPCHATRAPALAFLLRAFLCHRSGLGGLCCCLTCALEAGP